MHELNGSRVLGVFPSLKPIGGVQTSGREAWQGIVRQIGGQRTQLLCYAPGSSKGMLILGALWNRRVADIILVWHLDLLKLMPMLKCRTSRVVLFLHGIEAWRRQDPLTKWALRCVNLFLTNSNHTWERFLQSSAGFQNATHQTIPLGLGTKLTQPTPAPSPKPVALMLGRLHKGEDYKGHRELIEAWPQVLQAVPRAELWIAGEGNLRRDLELLARTRGLNGQVRFWGQVPEKEKEKLIEQCRCLALPSRGEGFGLVYLEAMRMGRPCLVSNNAAGFEVVNPPEAGLAADPDDPRQVADAMIRLLTCDREWNQWSAQARERYESRFTAEQFHKRLNAALFSN